MQETTSTHDLQQIEAKIEQEKRELDTKKQAHTRQAADADRKRLEYERKQSEADALKKKYEESKAEADRMQAEIQHLEQQRQTNLRKLADLQRNIVHMIKSEKN
jgi:flagellar biosynthesis/type III secretory pathway protein FliH